MSAGHAESALHAALIARFKADAELTALVGQRFLEWPKEGETFPMVTLGDYSSSPNDTDTSVGSDIEATIHTWAKGPSGRVVARQIGEKVSKSIHRQAFDIPGFRVVLCVRTFADVFRDEASESGLKSDVGHGVFRYRFLIEATA